MNKVDTESSQIFDFLINKIVLGAEQINNDFPRRAECEKRPWAKQMREIFDSFV
jgi:hypothetical protein